MNNNVNFRIDDVRFNYRLAGVTVRDGKVLLHKVEGNNFWSLPGGRCAINEDSRTALGREYEEEMGQTVELTRVLWLVEYFYNEKATGENFHELSVIYEVVLPENGKFMNEEFEGVEAGKKILFKWFDLRELKDLEFYPVFLKEKLQKLPESMEHIIFRAG